jgi:hypothetical protein
MTSKFFAAAQNKLSFAAHEHTATELVYDQVDNDMIRFIRLKPNFGVEMF